MRCKIIFLLLFLCCHPYVYANDKLGNRFHATIGTDLFQMQYKEQRYYFDKYDALKNPLDNITRVSWGLTYRVFENIPVYIGIKTNRGINFATTTKAFDTKARKNVIVSTKTIADSVFIGGAVHQYLIPFIVATRLYSDTEINYQNGLLFNSSKKSLFYGYGVAIPFKQKHTISIAYFLPNKGYNTKRMFGLSYNYTIL
jgi:hypothetical protein